MRCAFLRQGKTQNRDDQAAPCHSFSSFILHYPFPRYLIILIVRSIAAFWLGVRTITPGSLPVCTAFAESLQAVPFSPLLRLRAEAFQSFMGFLPIIHPSEISITASYVPRL
jgi:hypothetical protein